VNLDHKTIKSCALILARRKGTLPYLAVGGEQQLAVCRAKWNATGLPVDPEGLLIWIDILFVNQARRRAREIE
jgi:hypothetical protein